MPDLKPSFEFEADQGVEQSDPIAINDTIGLEPCLQEDHREDIPDFRAPQENHIEGLHDLESVRDPQEDIHEDIPDFEPVSNLRRINSCPWRANSCAYDATLAFLFHVVYIDQGESDFESVRDRKEDHHDDTPDFQQVSNL